ncbi:hypothetical protein EJ06DRAFT_530493 [Trichodelitschia bisporula]|uniref:Serine hydrolase domain-containing protein n=1 Tax=Trichodelitschia bisporula TaxID=703511 RepID=A0A6G1HX59_9PEZI|nr:hypothetical protein EJ06DRAFT_530493 [Trichodelitschia bisporula]
MSKSATLDPTLHNPRILCLHGGGVTGEVFQLQARALIARLNPYFRLVFADGPFLCDAGPGIEPVYSDFAPFRRWLRWLPEHTEIDDESAADEVWYQLRRTMDDDNVKGATGEWVGMMGFSQGAKLAASLLYDQQAREEKLGKGKAGTNWRFAVLLAGRAPLVSFSEASKGRKGMVGAGEVSEGFTDVEGADLLRYPTIHVHGLADKGLHLHRRLLDQYCDKKTATVVEWDGDHRVPIKSKDVVPVVDAILDVARQTEALKG